MRLNKKFTGISAWFQLGLVCSTLHECRLRGWQSKGGHGMIEVRDLVKRYGRHTAVDHLSFTVERGQVYGFLGPNGAGKIHHNEHHDRLSGPHRGRGAGGRTQHAQ